MTEYIDIPIDTDPQDILNDAISYLQSVMPGWDPNTPNLDVWILMAVVAGAAEARDVASAVPKSIFRYFGANLAGVPPIDATPASSTVTFTAVDNAGYTVPAGTLVSIDSGGTPIPFATQLDAVIPPGSTTVTNVQIVAVDAGADGSDLGSIGGAITLIDPLSFVSSVTLLAVTTGGVDAESDDDYLDRLAAELSLLAPRPILPDDFAVFARNISGVDRAVAIDGYNPLHNLLTANEASIETDASGWVAYSGAPTVARSTAQASDGVASLSVTATGTSGMDALLANAKPCTPGESITAIGRVRANTTTRNARIGLIFTDITNTTIVGTYWGATTAESNTAFTDLGAVTATAPAGAYNVKILLEVMTTTAVGEVHYFDRLSLRRGTTTDWVAGGTAETGNPRMVAVAAVDSTGTPVSAPVKASIQSDLQGRREVNFVVNTLDPVVSQIDVSYTVKVSPGFIGADVVAAVTAAIQGFLDPSTWGSTSGDPHAWENATVVRFNKLVQTIENVEGVDYIPAGSLTLALHGFALAAADVTLPGAAPLASAGTITGAFV